MAGVIFSAFISIGLPFMALMYACFKNRFFPFFLGVLVFVISQVLLRIPLLEYLGKNSPGFIMYSATQPILFAIVIGLSAGIFEELARYIAMRFFMKQRDWQAGFLFGTGHGGIEAVLFVGVPAITLLFTQTIPQSEMFLISGVERFFAMVLHIGLSIIVLQSVVQKSFIYVLIAIAIHGFIDALVGILPLYVSEDSMLFLLEVTVAMIALIVFIYCIWIKRKGVL